jgi:hypothetical protein
MNHSSGPGFLQGDEPGSHMMEPRGAGFLRGLAIAPGPAVGLIFCLTRKDSQPTGRLKMPTTFQRMLSVTVVALFAALFVAVAARAQSAAAPRAVMPNTTYAFGDIYKGETISQIFVIRNEGGADLVVKDFVGACGCEVLGVDRVIAPGKEGGARVEINTASQPGGELFKIAMLHTNDPERPTITLTLKANLLTSGNGGPVNGVELRAGKHIGPVFVGPDTINGFVVAPGKTGRAEFSITVERGPLTLQRLESAGKVISARLETLEPGKRYKVVVENLPAQAEGLLQEQLRVITDSPVLPSFPLTVRIKVHSNP